VDFTTHPPINLVQDIDVTFFLCPRCISHDLLPSLSAIAGVAGAYHQMGVCVAEGRALTYLADRGVLFAENARRVLESPEISTALQVLARIVALGDTRGVNLETGREGGVDGEGGARTELNLEETKRVVDATRPEVEESTASSERGQQSLANPPPSSEPMNLTQDNRQMAAPAVTSLDFFSRNGTYLL